MFNKKIDNLFKRSQFFEKLAVFSDRKIFLQSLAQSITPFTKEYGESARQQLESILQDLSALNINRPEIIKPIFNALNNTETFDKQELFQALQLAEFYFPTDSNHATQLENLKQLKDSLSEPNPAPTNNNTSLPTNTVPTKTNKPTFSSVPIDVQRGLNTLLGANLVLDGQLGTQTRKALDAFKTEYHVESNMSDKDVFDIIRDTVKRQLA